MLCRAVWQASLSSHCSAVARLVSSSDHASCLPMASSRQHGQPAHQHLDAERACAYVPASCRRMLWSLRHNLNISEHQSKLGLPASIVKSKLSCLLYSFVCNSHCSYAACDVYYTTVSQTLRCRSCGFVVVHHRELREGSQGHHAMRPAHRKLWSGLLAAILLDSIFLVACARNHEVGPIGFVVAQQHHDMEHQRSIAILSPDNLKEYVLQLLPP